ncbi:hypothetical protein DY124_06140 [Apilactobacillus micheneri]|uniref:hypothetical protein n=1 Tax=Apilactobacillus micheneri TaxID=1899430 RepID=UPI0011276738|nr:hypothetical protein [Apilactobacillus micheneri]TPR43154.1 hypothetical protein DY124_06140 [Apilactobacillus micheneri]TPR47242.1 hypothetical protein DY125_06635 [Apilactobacillus micheneri]
MEKIKTLSPIHINTSYDRPVLDAGMAGVMLINPSDHEGLQNYHGLSEVIKDYGIGTPVYSQADAYFGNDNSPLFQVLSYKAGDGNSLTNTMSKYYSAGAQFFLIHMDITDKNVSDISAISNFVEAQDNKELIIDLTYSDVTKLPGVVSGLNIDNNKSTLVMAKNLVNGNDEYQGAHFLANYANAGLGIDAALVNNLNGVTPQDQYEFSKNELDQYFTPNKIATYAWRGSNPMMTSGVSQSGDQFQAMVVRDAITNEVTSSLNNVLLQNNGRITYDNTGIKLFENSIYGVLNEYVTRGFIEPQFNVKSVDADDISENKKASGRLTGMNWKYTPKFTIDDASFSQTVVLPQAL